MATAAGIPSARITALISLLFPEEMTPTAKRQFELVVAEHRTTNGREDVADAAVLDAIAQLAWHGQSSAISVLGTHDTRVAVTFLRSGHVFSLDSTPDRRRLVEWGARARTRNPNQPFPEPPD